MDCPLMADDLFFFLRNLLFIIVIKKQAMYSQRKYFEKYKGSISSSASSDSTSLPPIGKGFEAF